MKFLLSSHHRLLSYLFALNVQSQFYRTFDFLSSLPFLSPWSLKSEEASPAPAGIWPAGKKLLLLLGLGFAGNKELHSRLEQLIIQLPLECSAQTESLYSHSYHGSLSQNEAKERAPSSKISPMS